MLYHFLNSLLPGNYFYQNPLFRAIIAILLAFAIVWLFGPRFIRLLIRTKMGDVPDFDHKALNELTGNYFYQNPLFRAIIAILLAFAIVWLFGPRFIRLLIRTKMGDVPDFDHKALNELTAHKANVPTGGGILMMIAIAVTIATLANLTVFYIHLAFFTIAWLGMLGYVDDRVKLRDKARTGSRDGLKFYQKLLFQIGLGVVLGLFIYWRGQLTFSNIEDASLEHFRIFTFPFFKGDTATGIYGKVLPPWAFYVITVMVVAGTSNAVNLPDGLDGLASGCVPLCCFVFMLLAGVAGDERVAEYMLSPHIPQA